MVLFTIKEEIKMNYIEIRNLLRENKLECSIELDIASCVSCCVDNALDDETYRLICVYTRAIWDKADKSYTQLMADIVCDCALDCGYGYRSKIKLTKNDLVKHNKLDKIIDLFLDRYWGE